MCVNQHNNAKDKNGLLTYNYNIKNIKPTWMPFNLIVAQLGPFGDFQLECEKSE